MKKSQPILDFDDAIWQCRYFADNMTEFLDATVKMLDELDSLENTDVEAILDKFGVRF